MKEELDEMGKNSEHVRVWYTVDKVVGQSKWQFSTGRVTEQMMKDHLPAPSLETAILFCGPAAMVKESVLPALDSIGYPASNRIAV